jgi:hypothetical protein
MEKGILSKRPFFFSPLFPPHFSFFLTLFLLFIMAESCLSGEKKPDCKKKKSML